MKKQNEPMALRDAAKRALDRVDASEDDDNLAELAETTLADGDSSAAMALARGVLRLLEEKKEKLDSLESKAANQVCDDLIAALERLKKGEIF